MRGVTPDHHVAVGSNDADLAVAAALLLPD